MNIVYMLIIVVGTVHKGVRGECAAAGYVMLETFQWAAPGVSKL